MSKKIPFPGFRGFEIPGILDTEPTTSHRTIANRALDRHGAALQCQWAQAFASACVHIRALLACVVFKAYVKCVEHTRGSQITTNVRVVLEFVFGVRCA